MLEDVLLCKTTLLTVNAITVKGATTHLSQEKVESWCMGISKHH